MEVILKSINIIEVPDKATRNFVHKNFVNGKFILLWNWSENFQKYIIYIVNTCFGREILYPSFHGLWFSKKKIPQANTIVLVAGLI